MSFHEEFIQPLILAKQRIATYKSNLNNLKSLFKQKSDELNKLKSQNNALTLNNTSNIPNQNQKDKDKIKELETELEDIKNKLEKEQIIVKDLGNNINVLKLELVEQKGISATYQDKTNKQQKENRKLTQRLETANKKIKKWENYHTKINLKGSKNSIKENVQKLQEDYDALLAENKELLSKIDPDFDSENENDAATIFDLQEQLENSQNSEKRAIETQKKLNEENDELKATSKEYSDEISSLKSKNTQLQTTNKNLEKETEKDKEQLYEYEESNFNHLKKNIKLTLDNNKLVEENKFLKDENKHYIEILHQHKEQ